MGEFIFFEFFFNRVVIFGRDDMEMEQKSHTTKPK
jgi:hypothetical protein